ncbi:hypothetical protein FHR71_005264 [Methylobacterium sp. RAS18]|nr:hypothetical protein [Methylobacterium sp. RAS18]
MLAIQWKTAGIIADFILPGSATQALRVSFERQCIVRLLDEMPLSTEEDDTPNEGLVPGHFAYRVEGARFARMQSEAWKEVNKPVSHYLFVTGWGCLDVVSSGKPTFSLVDRSENLHRRNDELGSGG